MRDMTAGSSLFFGCHLEIPFNFNSSLRLFHGGRSESPSSRLIFNLSGSGGIGTNGVILVACLNTLAAGHVFIESRRTLCRGVKMSQTDATVTVRIIKSFEYRNHRNLVLHHLDLAILTLPALRDIINKHLAESPALKPIANGQYDTVKLYAQPHGAKCNNPIINIGGDEYMILKDEESPLCELGVGHETELSYFNLNDYKAYQLNPISKW